ncbi:MAG: ribose 5-phosphate isomerase B [Chitinophagaceae bacterium]|nr:ribose 5-phosphate isomerase B [Chitinophagaceae bacterium]
MSANITLSIGCDHAGYLLKDAIIQHYGNRFTFIDRGTSGPDSVDYPDYAHPVALDVEEGRATFGILICGSANGVCMTANKHAGIRAALCWKAEIAELARQHNDANILCLPARFMTTQEAFDCADVFLSTAFEGGRHQNRVNKIACQ